jgi:hypothetical protein
MNKLLHIVHKHGNIMYDLPSTVTLSPLPARLDSLPNTQNKKGELLIQNIYISLSSSCCARTNSFNAKLFLPFPPNILLWRGGRTQTLVSWLLTHDFPSLKTVRVVTKFWAVLVVRRGRGYGLERRCGLVLPTRAWNDPDRCPTSSTPMPLQLVQSFSIKLPYFLALRGICWQVGPAL